MMTRCRTVRGRVAVRALLAAQLALGLFSAMAMAGGELSCVVGNGGFEEGAPTNCLPQCPEPCRVSNVPGLWWGNPASFVGPENGVTPRSGLAMLRYEGTDTCTGGSGLSGDVLQTIDLAAYAPIIDAGHVSIEFAAYVNSAGSPNVDTEYRITVISFSGAADQMESSYPSAGQTGLLSTNIVTDTDGGTWEEISILFDVPPTTRSLALNIIARENVHDGPLGDEFEGNYADDVSCVILVACPGDLDGSGDVSVTDLLQLLAAWGPCAAPCLEDLASNGAVDVNDLLVLLASWGPCP